MTTVNAWHIYRMSGLEQKDLLHFKASTARALINAGSVKTRARGKPSATPPPVKRRAVSKAPPEIRFGTGNHWPQLTEAKNANRCHDAACTRRTKYICMQCLVALCPGCFANYNRKYSLRKEQLACFDKKSMMHATYTQVTVRFCISFRDLL